MADLKPCPCRFCDSPALHGALLPEFRVLRMVQTPEKDPERYFWYCAQCTQPMPLAAWNRRTPSPAVRALVEAVKRFSAGWIYCSEGDDEGPCCDGCVDVSAMRKALAAVEKEINDA